MQIEHKTTRPVATFGGLNCGQMFRNAGGEGLFLKTGQRMAILIEDADGYTPAPRSVQWDPLDTVTPVTRIVVYTEG